MPEREDRAEYLGDSVYVKTDLYRAVVLTTDSHEDRRAQNRIVLEPDVAVALMRWLRGYLGEKGV